MNEKEIAHYSQVIGTISENIKRVFVGRAEVVDLLLVGFISGLHVLIEDVPGVGKTTLAKSLSASLGLDFCRIQFTPDLLPGDIVGMTIWKNDIQEFIFKQGSIMHQFILADEINRASPRTQSSLLEAMQEQSVTVDGRTYELPSPFFVVATQNPSTFMGAFQLPEGEIDRFGISFSIGYPTDENEKEILKRFQSESPLPELKPVVSLEELLAIQTAVRKTHVSDAVRDYLVEIIRATRSSRLIQLGASPRASGQLQRAAQAHAFMKARSFVIPEDLMAVAAPVLAHRVVLAPEAKMAGSSTHEVIDDLVKEAKVPVGFA